MDSSEEMENEDDVVSGEGGEEERTETVENLNEEVEDKKDEEKKEVKPKRVIRNPQPKLDAERLKGPRGLAALEGYFKNVKFKGPKHEEEDLRKIMKIYEYWCHRMFPKYPFDDCLAKLEKLGTKRPVQTYVTKIRMDMITEDAPRILSDEEGDDSTTGNNTGLVADSSEQGEGQGAETGLELTEDQLERIRLNREKALILRQERLQKAKDMANASMMRSQALTENFEGESRASDCIKLTQNSGTTTRNREDASEYQDEEEESLEHERESLMQEENFQSTRDKSPILNRLDLKKKHVKSYEEIETEKIVEVESDEVLDSDVNEKLNTKKRIKKKFVLSDNESNSS